MKRTITTERIYQIRPYETIKVTDAIIELPDEVALNQEVYDKVRLVQLLGLDLSYRRYLEMNSIYQDFTPEDIRENLEKAIKSEMEKLQNLLYKSEEE
jgi:hypothetical protein